MTNRYFTLKLTALGFSLRWAKQLPGTPGNVKQRRGKVPVASESVKQDCGKVSAAPGSVQQKTGHLQNPMFSTKKNHFLSPWNDKLSP
jgi:hypothetical protein